MTSLRVGFWGSALGFGGAAACLLFVTLAALWPGSAEVRRRLHRRRSPERRKPSPQRPGSSQGLRAAALVGVALGLLALVIFAPWRSAAEEGQNAEPKAGTPGQRFDFFATGFDDDEEVGFWGVRPDGVTVSDGAGQVIANDDGRADWFWISPADAMPGAWLIVAQGKDSGQLRTFRIEILGPGGVPAPPAPVPAQPQPDPAQPIAVQPPGTFIPAGFTLEPQGVTVRAGQSLTFVGTGFLRDERVASWATGPDAAVVGGAAVSASGDAGRAEVTFEVPERALGGQWAFTLKGDASQAPVTIVFYVTAGSPVESQAAVVPVVGAPGTSFSFVAVGFSDDERVGFWVTDPSGRVFTAQGLAEDNPDSNIYASDRGVVRFNWQAPADAQHGIWVMTVQGIKSGASRGVPFEVR